MGTSSDHVPVLFEIVCPRYAVNDKTQFLIDYSKLKNYLRAAFTSIEGGQRNTDNICTTLDISRKQSAFQIKRNKDSAAKIWWNDECSRDYK